MQGKRSKILVATLSIMVVLIVIFSWRNSSGGRSEINENIFQVEDYKAIDRVLLEQNGEKIDLKFNGTRWKVNEQFDADRNMVNVLFATLEQAKPKRRFSAQKSDSLETGIINSGVKVSLFVGQSLEREFYAAGNRAKTQGYFYNPANKESYVMEIPGYRVYVSGIFELDQNGWRDKYVFNFNWRNFSGLDVRFPNTPSENFKVSLSKDFFGIEGFDADTAKLNAFLDNVSLLTVDRYENDPSLQDSLSQKEGIMEIIVRDIANREYSLRLFPSRASQVLALVPENQAAYFNPQKIQSIVRPKSFFRKR